LQRYDVFQSDSSKTDCNIRLPGSSNASILPFMPGKGRNVRLVQFLLGLIIPLAIAQPALSQGGAAAVVVDPVRSSQISDTRPVIGRLVASVRSQIAARAAGVAEDVTFKVGDRVRSGEVLVRLDTTLAEIERQSATAARKMAEAGVAVAEAKLALAQQAFERQSQLQSSTAFSRSRFDDLRQAMEQARSELAQARANVGTSTAQIARAEYTLKHSSITAPFDGVVIAREAQPGEYLQLGSTVATLLDTSALEIDADVPTALVAGLRTGQQVQAVFDGDRRPVMVTVRAVVPVYTLATRTRSVRFGLDLGALDQTSVAVGATVTLSIPASAPRDVLTVSKDGLVQARDGWMVFVAKDGKADPRPIELGMQVGDRVEVTSGLAKGDLVVVRGNERLRPGQALQPRQLGNRVIGKPKASDET
jgi:RND family efflux transporter MFP subunit